ncbi:cationic amino acid transport permease [Gracilaria domingensis]|nr:cationic amino acid transport permease [Gracilaria domingensis]
MALGSQKVDTQNWGPFLPFGFKGVITASSAIFLPYLGFEELPTAAEEAVDAYKTVRLAIILSMAAVTNRYIASLVILTGLVNYSQLGMDAPFSVAYRVAGLLFIARVVTVGTVLGMMNTASVSIAAHSRIFLSIGREGLLPRSFAHSTRLRTLICGIIVAVLAGGTLLAFLATNLTLLSTRSRFHSSTSNKSSLIYGIVFGSAICGLCTKLVVEKLLST